MQYTLSRTCAIPAAAQRVGCRYLTHLRGESRGAVERLRHKRSVLRSCATQRGYAVSEEVPAPACIAAARSCAATPAKCSRVPTLL